jgi:predicted transcriptional regulator
VKGIIVREPWASLIVNGKKRWEIRRTNTKYRGPVAIISAGKVIGIAEIKDVLELPVEEIAPRIEKHYADPLLILRYGTGRKTLYAWVLKNARKLKEPIEIELPRGAQIWVNIPPEMEEEIWKSLEE